MFLALSAAPYYLTMTLSGVLSGTLLDRFYTKDRSNIEYIWIIMMSISGLSLILLILFQRCFQTRDSKIEDIESDEEEDEFSFEQDQTIIKKSL